MEELVNIQSELKAPKSQFNKFGGYNYRSAEDILEAVKPLLKSNNAFLTISDEIECIGERFYIKATATITASGQSISVSAYAREEESKKGMDGAQVTGSASSYARKYALNGLFCIDDTKDADSINTHGKKEAEPGNAELKQALAETKKCKNVAELQEVWAAHPDLWSDYTFKVEVTKLKNKFNNAA